MMEMSWGWKSRYHTSCRILSWTCWPPLLPPPMMMLHNLKPTHSFLYSCQSERGSTLCFEVCQCKLYMKLYWSEQWTVPHTMVRLLDSRTQSHWNKREFNSNLRFFLAIKDALYTVLIEQNMMYWVKFVQHWAVCPIVHCCSVHSVRNVRSVGGLTPSDPRRLQHPRAPVPKSDFSFHFPQPAKSLQAYVHICGHIAKHVFGSLF